jgi:hypothetical protein
MTYLEARGRFALSCMALMGARTITAALRLSEQPGALESCIHSSILCMHSSGLSISGLRA